MSVSGMTCFGFSWTFLVLALKFPCFRKHFSPGKWGWWAILKYSVLQSKTYALLLLLVNVVSAHASSTMLYCHLSPTVPNPITLSQYFSWMRSFTWCDNSNLHPRKFEILVFCSSFSLIGILRKGSMKRHPQWIPRFQNSPCLQVLSLGTPK